MEGPSLVILHEELTPYLNQKVLKVSGNTKQPKENLKGRTLSRIETWGKVLFLFFSKKNAPDIVTKTHFLMFGSYRINDPKENRDPRLELKFKNGTVYFYSCSLLFGADEYFAKLDRKVDVLSPEWDEKYVLSKLEKKTGTFLCDLFLDQSLFAGSGNIVKNEVLFNIRRHPLTKLSQVRKSDWPKLVHAIREYCENFYHWKKNFELRKHWQVYRQSRCPLCERKLIRENLGKHNRRTFYCPEHQPRPKTRAASIRVFDVLPVRQRTQAPEARLEH